MALTCTWVQDRSGNYHAACREDKSEPTLDCHGAFDPCDLDVKFCPYCGYEIDERPNTHE